MFWRVFLIALTASRNRRNIWFWIHRGSSLNFVELAQAQCMSFFSGNDKQACMIMMFFPFSDWYRRLKAVADPDLQIIRARSSRPWDKGGGRRVVWKKIFSALRASVSSKNKGGGGEERTPPLYTPLPSSPKEKGPSDHACTLQGFVCLKPKKGQDWLPHFELFWTFSFHG